MSAQAPQDLTRILNDVTAGRHDAAIQLLELIYSELHRLAGSLMRKERSDHTLQPTALIHEAYLRLLSEQTPNWANRAHFFGAAAEVMRRILIDHARARRAIKRGGDRARVQLESGPLANLGNSDDLLDIDEAIRQFEAIEPRRAQVVKLRFFAGLTFEEISAVLDVSPVTVKRDWRFARAWLATRIQGLQE